MSKELKVVNPFYVALLPVGVVFAITACAYGVMAVKMLKPDAAALDPSAPLTLVSFLDRHGFTVLMVEVALLAVTTCAAIFTDDYWTGRAQARAERKTAASAADEAAPGQEEP